MTKTNLSVISIPNVTQTAYQEVINDRNEYVSYGSDNKFPFELWDLYTKCATHQSIIDGKVDYIGGEGITKGNELINENGDTLNSIVKKLALDQQLYGGFALQIVYNKAGSIYGIYWVDFSKLRISKNAKEIGFSDTWGSYANNIIKYDAYNPTKEGKTSQILYHKSSMSRSVYPLPTYLAAIPSIKTEIAIQNYHLNNIMNGFASSFVLNMNNGVPEEEERKDLERVINDKFCGSDNAGRLLINWNETPENASTINKIETDNLDTKFQQLSKDTQRNIFVAHRVTSPVLFGIVPENTGFSKTEYKESFDVFNITIIRPLQREIENAISSILNDEYKITPLTIV